MSGSVGDNPYRASGVVAAASGGGGLEWCSSIKSTAFCASAGKGYFVNTCGGGVTVTLPGTATQGETIEFKDYKRTWGTSALTINSNSLNYQGTASAAINYTTDGNAVKIVYADATRGWTPTVDDDASCGHTYEVQYLVVAGGGGGGPGEQGGGGGAGGMRNVATKSFTVAPGTPYTVTVGGGGAAPCYPGSAVVGCASVFSTITSAGGGYGGQGSNSGTKDGDPGGSGGGGGHNCGTAGTGNVPATTPDQGNNGGAAYPGAANLSGAGGGGGHSCVGAAGTSTAGGPGGDGTVCAVRGSPFDPVAYAGGGGGAAFSGTPGTGGAGGGGESGKGSPVVQGTAGTANTGGGGGGMGIDGSCDHGGAGGSGIVIVRRLTASSTTTSGTVTTCGSDTIHTFTSPGTYTG